MQISAVILAKNSASTIGGVIESLLRQAHAPEEIIVVDDGSTDATSETVKSYDEVLLLRQSPLGKGAALNNAALMASHEWIVLFDADAPVSRDTIARHIKLHRQRPELKASYEAMCLSGTMLHRSVLDAIGLFDEAGDDESLWRQIASCANAASLEGH